MKVVYETRFSFVGKPGRTSAPADDPAVLFDDERLEERMRVFEDVTLPSLIGQTDLYFEHLVVASTLMPERWKRRLRELTHDMLGEEHSHLIFHPPAVAGHVFRKWVTKTYPDDEVAQVVLGDQDAVSIDFTAMVQHYADYAGNDPVNPRPYTFLSFPRGYTLGIEPGGEHRLAPRYLPYANPGLTLIARGSSPANPYLTNHRRVGEQHPSLMITHPRPFYLRSVNGREDNPAVAIEDCLEDAALIESFRYFPWLARLFPETGPLAEFAML